MINIDPFWHGISSLSPCASVPHLSKFHLKLDYLKKILVLRHLQMVPRIFRLSRGTGCGDPEIRGPNWLGTICPGGPNSWGPFVQGDQIFGDHLSMGTEFDGDHLSRGINLMGIVCLGGQEVGDRKPEDQMGSGPNASQPIESIVLSKTILFLNHDVP